MNQLQPCLVTGKADAPSGSMFQSTRKVYAMPVRDCSDGKIKIMHVDEKQYLRLCALAAEATAVEQPWYRRCWNWLGAFLRGLFKAG